MALPGLQQGTSRPVVYVIRTEKQDQLFLLTQETLGSGQALSYQSVRKVRSILCCIRLFRRACFRNSLPRRHCHSAERRVRKDSGQLCVWSVPSSSVLKNSPLSEISVSLKHGQPIMFGRGDHAFCFWYDKWSLSCCKGLRTKEYLAMGGSSSCTLLLLLG